MGLPQQPGKQNRNKGRDKKTMRNYEWQTTTTPKNWVGLVEPRALITQRNLLSKRSGAVLTRTEKQELPSVRGYNAPKLVKSKKVANKNPSLAK